MLTCNRVSMLITLMIRGMFLQPVLYGGSFTKPPQQTEIDWSTCAQQFWKLWVLAETLAELRAQSHVEPTCRTQAQLMLTGTISSFIKYWIPIELQPKELQKPWTFKTNKQSQLKGVFCQQHLNCSYPIWTAPGCQKAVQRDWWHKKMQSDEVLLFRSPIIWQEVTLSSSMKAAPQALLA